MVGFASNGSANGDSQDKVWTVGLINSHLKYLTAETFGHKINANGTALRKKQTWTLEPAGGCSAAAGSCLVLLRSHLGCYLTVDQFGNVTCDTELESVSEADGRCVFEVKVAGDGSGRWSLMNVERRYCLGAGGDSLVCTAKTATADTELWYVQLAARPQINLYNVGRKRFARAVGDSDEGSSGASGTTSEPSDQRAGAQQLCVDANVPWGADCLVTLHFLADSRLYTIHTSSNLYLNREGELQRTCTEECVFSVEYHGGCLALRDLNGLYLSPVGSKAVLRSRARTVGRDEQFTLQNSPAQCILIAALNDKLVSIKQGVDVTANQDEVGECERFLLQPCQTRAKSGPRWRLETGSGLNWRLDSSTSGVQASSPNTGEGSEFQFEWHDDGSMSVLAETGRALAAKKSGHLFANADSSELSARFYFHLINRPVLVLKCEQGYIGYKSSSGGADCGFKLECNKVNYEIIRVERSERGQMFFKGESGMYWDVSEAGESVACCSRRPNLALYVELRASCQLCVKDMDGRYLTAGKNGALTMKTTSADNATYWQF